MWKSFNSNVSRQTRKARKLQSWFCKDDKGDVKRDASGNIRPIKTTYRTIPKDIEYGRNKKLSEFE